MKLNIFLVGIFLTSTACVDKPKGHHSASDSTVLHSRSMATNLSSTKNTRPTFVYQDDTLLQQIVLLSRNDSIIHFIFTTTNKKDSSTYQIKGAAKAHPNQDPEIDIDEEAGGYPAIEYIYSDKCILSIRIDLDSNKRITIIDHGGGIRQHCHCTLTSPGILRKVE